MPGIITITLNPAIDKSTSVPAIQPEKKLRCSTPVFEPGGGGVNVARAIHKLGGEATALYLAGGYTGRFFKQLLDKEGVHSSVVEIEGHTRENLVVLDSATNHQYRFGMPGPSIKEKEWQELLRKIEEIDSPGFIVCSGSVPPGVPTDIFARIGRIASEKKAKFILDSSGEPLQSGITNGVYLIKPNLGELSLLAGTNWLTDEAIEITGRKILSGGQCENIVVSMGSNGAMLITSKGSTRVTPPPVPKKSTVGAGDSMVAGIVWSLVAGKQLDLAVQYGVACGTAATMNSGTELCRKEDADEIFAKCKIEQHLFDTRIT